MTWDRRAPVPCAALATLLAAAVLATACGSPGNLTPITAESAGPPLPSGAVEQDATSTPGTSATGITTAGPPAPDCTVPGSLRPLRNDHSGTAVARVRERGRVIVGLDQGSNLFSFRDPLSGDLLGFDVDIAREVARDLVGDPDRVEFHFLSSAGREEALRDGTVDIVVKTMTITCERAQTVAFSSVYFLAHQRILVPRGSTVTDAQSLGDARVCIVAGTTSVAALRAAAPATRVLTVPSWGDCLVALQQRQVDAVSTDDSILAGMAAQDPNLKIVGPAIEAEPYGIAMRQGEDDLVRFVNGTLERLRASGRWDEIYNRWLSVLGPTVGPPEATYID